MENVVEVKNLKKVFQTKIKEEGLMGSLKSVFRPQYKEIIAVDDISFDVKKGEMLAFIGPNGAGKSTTIKMLVGILFPTSGDAKVLGYNPWKERQKLSFHIGSIFGQKPQLWYHLPAIDTFNLFSKIYELDQKEYKKRLEYLSEVFEVKEFINVPVRRLSLGQRMKCELIASMLHKPQIIFMDEPTIGLDIVTKQIVRDLIKKLNKEEKTTIFLTSHDAGDVEKLCNRVIVINNGKMVFNDKLSVLKKEFLVKKTIKVETEAPIKRLRLMEGVKKASGKKYSAELEVNTKKIPVGEVVDYLSEKLEISDITISDPPIEEIISEIYKRTR